MEIEEERPSQSKRFVRFKENVASEIDDRGWYRDIGLAAVLAAAAAFAGLGALLAFIASREWSSVAPTWRSVVLIGLAVGAFLNAVVIGAALFSVRFWRRRSPEGAGGG